MAVAGGEDPSGKRVRAHRRQAFERPLVIEFCAVPSDAEPV
jgi:hypothetical protein